MSTNLYNKLEAVIQTIILGGYDIKEANNMIKTIKYAQSEIIRLRSKLLELSKHPGLTNITKQEIQATLKGKK